MCGRYYRQSDKQRLASAFRLGELPADFVLPPADYNVAPTSYQAVIRQNRDTLARELVLMRWGMVPHFAASLADFKGISNINAKAENLMQSAMWRVPFQRRRCLIPADGFYEWKLRPTITANGVEGKPVKVPFRFGMASGDPFAFAGLWDAWKLPKSRKVSVHTPDTWLQSFTIITTEPNELTAKFHTRMPVILHPRDYDRWLAREATSYTGAGHGQPPLDLLRPYPAEDMEAHEAHRDVGSVRNNHPELLNSA